MAAEENTSGVRWLARVRIAADLRAIGPGRQRHPLRRSADVRWPHIQPVGTSPIALCRRVWFHQSIHSAVASSTSRPNATVRDDECARS